jgi:hypothetical protein
MQERWYQARADSRGCPEAKHVEALQLMNMVIILDRHVFRSLCPINRRSRAGSCL